MKKLISVCLAGAIGAATAVAASACGPYKVPLVAGDRDAAAYSDADATLSVDAKTDEKDTMKISKELFGVFLEDINYASYALDADLVVNGSFEAIKAGEKYGWKTVGSASFAMEQTDGVLASVEAYKNKNVNPKYAKVHVTGINGGISNSGYADQEVPMAVKAGTKYTFSAFVKSPDKAAEMTVKVTDGKKTYLSEKIPVGQDSAWVKYVRHIEAEETADTGLRLDITFGAAGDYYLDGVRFETEDSTVGIKNYIYDAVKELSPKFIRFPGGCIIEGANETEAYDWKNSVGAVQTGDNAGDDEVPAFSYKIDTDGTVKENGATYGEPVTRTPNYDLWGDLVDYYDMTYSIGFFEYFKLCESVGASAVPVLNCGLSDQGGAANRSAPHTLKGRHGKEVEDYIRDAVDLIEFAKGDTSTKWGKIRADMGHPEPFEMNYLGIGNEQFEQYYTDYYEKFLENDAFREALRKYSVKTIVGNGLFISNCENSGGMGRKGTAQTAAENYVNADKIVRVSEYGVHDQHYYVNYTTLLSGTDMYDAYSRYSYTRYEVFVGEYSANTSNVNFPQDRNQWITALSEAAMMTAYERNGDVVVLAAYAPMFAAWDGARQWPTDMMYFTNTQLVRTANYYVQQLFMNNFADHKPASVKLAFADGSENACRFASPVSAKQTAEAKKLYYTVSVEKGGDVIVKLVNVMPDAIKLNLDFKNAKLSGLADVTVLQNDDIDATNTLENLSSPAVAPVKFTLGNFGGATIGYEVPGRSVTAIRLHTAG